jgi:hypothetical protein
MYDLPELEAATDRLWSALAESFRAEGVCDVPDGLVRDRSPEAIWNDPQLLFAQTCGYPWMRGLSSRVALVATPRYRAFGCEGAAYSSLIVVPVTSRAENLADLRGAVCAVNQATSHSGMNALRAMIAPLSDGRPFFGSVRMTGSHAGSLDLVARKEAGVAAIDCITYALLEDVRPALCAGARVLTKSAPAPAPPFISAARDDVPRLRSALARVPIERLAPLRIEGFEILEADRYRTILDAEAFAIVHGYGALA